MRFGKRLGIVGVAGVLAVLGCAEGAKFHPDAGSSKGGGGGGGGGSLGGGGQATGAGGVVGSGGVMPASGSGGSSNAVGTGGAMPANGSGGSSGAVGSGGTASGGAGNGVAGAPGGTGGSGVPPGTGGNESTGTGGAAGAPPPANGSGGAGGKSGPTCNSPQHLCSGSCVDDSPAHCGSMCATCTAPAGGTATCTGGACDFTCGSMKKCGQKCIPATEGSCCTDQDCPAQAGKTPRCDTSTNMCSYACSGTTKPCGATCIPSGGCCANSDCTTPQTCGGGGTANMCGCTRNPATCTGKCGTVKDNCGVNVDCGTSACGAGQTCNSSNSCTCGGRQCTSICCAAPPAGTMSMCINNGAQCAVQCNAGTHSCSSTAPPCYSDTDVQHCGSEGGPCTDCRQANANETCGVGGACANTCKGTTLSCPGVGGKPNCGSWDFESGTEGWAIQHQIQPDVAANLTVSTSVAHKGSQSLSVGHTGEGFSNLIVQLCPSSNQVNLSQYRLLVDIYIVPSNAETIDMELELWLHTGAAPHTNDYEGSMSLDPDDGSSTNVPFRTWKTLRSTGTLQSTSGSGITALELNFRTLNSSWAGTVYFDNVRIQ